MGTPFPPLFVAPHLQIVYRYGMISHDQKGIHHTLCITPIAELPAGAYASKFRESNMSNPCRALAAFLLLALLQLTASSPSPALTAELHGGGACGLNCAAFYDLGSFHGCLRSALKVTGTVVLPGDRTFANASLVCNARFAPRPAAVVYAHSVADITAAVKCGLAWDVRVSASSGRHSNQATSMPDNYLIIDLTNLTKVKHLRYMHALRFMS